MIGRERIDILYFFRTLLLFCFHSFFYRHRYVRNIILNHRDELGITVVTIHSLHQSHPLSICPLFHPLILSPSPPPAARKDGSGRPEPEGGGDAAGGGRRGEGSRAARPPCDPSGRAGGRVPQPRRGGGREHPGGGRLVRRGGLGAPGARVSSEA